MIKTTPRVRGKPPDLTETPAHQAVNAPRITGVGTAVPGKSFSQQELLDTFRITDAKVRSVFLNGAIGRRCLSGFLTPGLTALLIRERAMRPGDHGVLMTTGPGSTIETALIQW
jgi:predicted naringenin-chalcone synthase